MRNTFYCVQGTKQQTRDQAENSWPFKKQSTFTKQRQMIEELQKIIILSDEENKKLHQQIAKITQKQKNTTIYYETKISQFQGIIQTQAIKIETLEHQKFKKDQSLRQSKILKSNLKSFKYCPFEDNKQNINTLNFNNQPCSNQLCFLKDKQLKESLTAMCKNLEYLLSSLEVRQSDPVFKQTHGQCAKQFQRQKQRKKDLVAKDSLSILKNIQLKMNRLQSAIDNLTHEKDFSSPLLASIKKIKQVQQNLLKIPFLEKINLNERRQKNEEIVAKAKMAKNNILSNTTQKSQ